MDKIKLALQVQRMSFDKLYNDIVEMISKPKDIDLIQIQGNLLVLSQKMEIITDLDSQMMDMLLETQDIDVIVLESVLLETDGYTKKYHTLKIKIERLTQLNDEVLSFSSQSKRKLKLPTIEFVKFAGDIKEWLSFWSQFKRIHEDDQIPNEDKFQYLIQATIPNSRARQLVDSYPPSTDNYPKVIDSLKKRFGRNDLLVEVYVRELLKLILNNSHSKFNLSYLYDKMESQIRALDTLGVTSDTCAAMLYPLVESCLPEDMIRVWQRSTLYDTDSSLKLRLEKLMEFLRKEVENEERVSLATSGFDLQSKFRKKTDTFRKIDDTPSTASDLMNKTMQKKCMFCKGSHFSQDCLEATKWSLTDRKKKLTESGCCLSCTRFGHISRRCRVYLKCTNCNGRHVTILCPKVSETSELTSKNSISVEQTLSNQTYSEVFLQTLVLNIKAINKIKKIRAIIDTGSQRSYVTKSVINDMEYDPIRKEEMIHALFGGTKTQVCTHNCYRIRLSTLNNSYSCNFEALDQNIICNDVTSVKMGPWISQLQLLGVKIADTKDGPIDVLIGADIAGKLFTGKRYELDCGLVAMETLLGWTVMGKVSIPMKSNISSVLVTSMFSQCNISDLWKLDVLGIQDPSDSKITNEEVIKTHFLNTVVQQDDGRYEVHMPWIEGHPPLSTNFNMARKRLINLKTKLINDGYFSDYEQVLNEWLAEKVIERVSEEEFDKQGHYLPHRHVVKLSSDTTKIRPVFDASAKEKGQPSLNQCLEKGINLIESIPSILLRFRMSRIGVVSDIRRAFLQIGLTSNDRDFLRFLWFDEKGDYIIYRHARVVFGVTCSPFLLGAVIDYHLHQMLDKYTNGLTYSRSVILKLLQSFYVDNCITSVDSKEELNKFIDESSRLMAEGKFDLRGWEYSIVDQDCQVPMITPVLGLNWNRNFDSLEVCGEWFRSIKTDIITKRVILSAANKLFDPIGFSCPVSLSPKLLLQQVWLSKIDWDTEVDDAIKNVFMKWVEDLPLLLKIRIPRWLLNSDLDRRLSLHVFCDASIHSYATVIFLRSENFENVYIQLVQAKNRLASLKKMTIPRLELLAATIGSRLAKTITDNLDFTITVYFWSDSTTVLAWIKNEDQWKPFVWNRVQEIRNISLKENWLYVPGEKNPADFPSRGCSAKVLLESKWWEGPSWLKKRMEEWPEQIYSYNDEDVNIEKKTSVTSSILCAGRNADGYNWYYNYFSEYEKIVRLLSWIQRFIHNCRTKNSKETGILSILEIEQAEIITFKLIQEEAFPEGLKNSKLSNLCPFYDNDRLIRIKTKISDREDTNDFRYPIVLPSNHIVVDRLIFGQHVKSCHVGVQGLLSILRERFWIIRGRKTVKSVISKCTICKRYVTKNLDYKQVSLPETRVRDACVFEVTGIDLAGPLYTRFNGKVWICLFTCAVYRAIHMELVSSLSTDNFLQALRRFIARRGRPSIIYSDNGTNFVGSNNVFKELDWEKISTYSTVNRIDWRFNAPTAAWWGGFWERLIRIVKDLLRKVLKKASLTYEELSTIICDCESVINSRPLTYVSEDNKDLVTLTPAMFLHEVKEVGVPDVDMYEAESFRRHLRYTQKLKGDIRKRFRNEYLGQLLLFSKKPERREIKEGDIVLIGDDNTKRIDWPLASVLELIYGRDGKCRVARLKTSTGQLTRPIQRVFPLEIECNVLKKRKKNVTENKVKKSDVENEVVITRSGRQVKPPSRFESC